VRCEQASYEVVRGGVVIKFVLGFGIGVALGMVFAPARGSETRARLIGRVEEVAELPRKKAAQMTDVTKERAGELGERIGRQAAEAAVDAVKNKVLGSDKSA
jgi:gas vesicle protein